LAYDEYGNPELGTAALRYGRLGGKQRSTVTVTGATLMGVRLCDPTLGRFLQTDPVPGGSANAFDYVGGDPVNMYDLNGMLRCIGGGGPSPSRSPIKRITILLPEAGGVLPYPVGSRISDLRASRLLHVLGCGAMACVASMDSRCLRVSVTYFGFYVIPSFAKCARWR